MENQTQKLNSTQSNGDRLAILDLAATIWKSKKKISSVFITFIVIGVTYALIIPSWYAAEVKLLPSKGKNNSSLSQYSQLLSMSGIQLPVGGEEYQNLYPAIIRSNFVLDRVLTHKFRTDKTDTLQTLFEFWDMDIDSTEAGWRHYLFESAKLTLREGYIQTELDETNSILTVRCLSPDYPILSAELTNYIVKQLEIYNKQYRKYKTTEQILFIEKSIKESKLNLEVTEEKLRSFKEENIDLNSPEKELEYNRIERELDVQQALYIDLRRQLESAKIEEIKEMETVNVLEWAEVPVKKFKPNRIFIVLVFAIFGFFISISYIFLEKYWQSNKDDFQKMISKKK